MKRNTFLAAAMLAAGLGLSGCATMSDGWETLIDGDKGLDNFNRIGEANWRGEGGAIVADKGAGGFLVSRKAYKDFQMRAEFWADDTTNSGIFFRATNPARIEATSAYEANIFDQRPDPTYGTGAIVDFAKVVPMPKAGGRWNTYEITARGQQLVVVFNGVQTVNISNGQFAQGPFGLQFANGANGKPGGAIKWRKLQVREL